MSSRSQIVAIFTFIGVGIAASIYGSYRRKQKASSVPKQSDLEQDNVVETRRRVHILYATTTGTARKFANTLYHHILRRCDFIVQINDLKDYSEDQLASEDIVLFLSSTFEDGTAPPSAQLFFNDLEDQAFDFRVGKDLLSKVSYAVFGLGGRIYGKNYCKIAMDLDVNMSKLGAERLEDVTFGDDQTTLEQTFYKWNSCIVRMLEKEGPVGKKITRSPNISEESVAQGQHKLSFVRSKSNVVSETCCKSKDEPQLKDSCCKDISDEEDGEEEEDLINNSYVRMNEILETDKNSGIIDMEEIGPAINRMSLSNVKQEDSSPREMVTKLQRKALTKEGYKIIGSHSAVKLCRWTKNQLRGRGGCYKHSFYGITSYQCMEATPSLACANKCVFCWRHHKNPVGTEWRWKADEPSLIVEEAVRLHIGMVHQLKGVPGVQPERLRDAHTVKHCALSLVGEPIMYPRINEMIRELHKREISSFLVTNAQFPDRIEQLEPVTQLYVSVDAATKDSLKAIDRPLFKDFWERFVGSLTALKIKPTRTVYRMTLVKSWNMNELENYVQLIEMGTPDFIEIKGVTYCGKSDASSLTMENVPWHRDVCAYAEEICKLVSSRNVCTVTYSIATEHEHSCCILIAREDKFKVSGEWYTWIDYQKFQHLVQEYYASDGKKLFGSIDYRAKTPLWAVYQSKERGFDPAEQRWRRNKATDETEPLSYEPTESGCEAIPSTIPILSIIMARAHLNVSQQIIDAFIFAQESRNIRILKVRILGEEMILEETIEKHSTFQEDFNSLLRNCLNETEACFVIYCLTDNEYGTLSWFLLAWVPEGCRVRDKMLYSSSREDLKFGLGLGYFKSDYCANQFADITWEAYENSLKRDFDPDILTDTERLMLEEKALTQKESGDVKSTALGVIPFELSSEVREKLIDFNSGNCNWIDVTVVDEVVQLLSAKTVPENEELKDHINPNVASFIIASFTKTDGVKFNFFVFSCPEDVNVRMKMTMSSSKASVSTAASAMGLNFDKNFEIREITELDDLVRAELFGSARGEVISSISSSAANVVHTKPQRPGRGKAKVSKFIAE